MNTEKKDRNIFGNEFGFYLYRK